MGPGLRRDDGEFVVITLSTTNALKNLHGTIALAGAGKMGGAMLTGWLAQGLDAKRVVVIEPHPSDEIKALAAQGIRLNPTPKDAGEADTLVVAVKPQSFREAGAALKQFTGSSTLVVSIMAGTPIAALEAVVGGSVVRAMPNTPAAIGRGITVAVAAKKVSAAQRAIADALLRATGSVEWVDKGRTAGRACNQAGARDRRRLRRVAAPLGPVVGDLAPERHLARRHHGGSARSADGFRRHGKTADARGGGGNAALEGSGEVAGNRRVGKAKRAHHPEPHRGDMVGTAQDAPLPTLPSLRAATSRPSAY
jgi:hypothetical protein